MSLLNCLKDRKAAKRRLMATPDKTEKCRFRAIGGIVIRFESVGSTNDAALRLAAWGLPEGAIVTAKIQTQGKGRRGKEWFSPSGGLFFSIVLRPKVPGAAISLLPIGAGVSVARAIRRLFNLPVTLKWPNDVILDGRKIAGILAQSSVATGQSLTILGFGVNVNNSFRSISSELSGCATSIVDNVRSQVKTEPLMKAIADEFAGIYSGICAGDSLTVVTWWKELSDMLGHPIIVHEGTGCFEALALDLGIDGTLLVQPRGGLMRRLISQDIKIRRIK